MVGNSNRWIVIRDFGAGNYIRILKITTQYSPHSRSCWSSLYNGCRHSTTQLRPHSTLFAFRPPMTARDFFFVSLSRSTAGWKYAHTPENGYRLFNIYWSFIYWHCIKEIFSIRNFFPIQNRILLYRKGIYFISTRHQTKKTLLHHLTYQISHPTTDVWIV